MSNLSACFDQSGNTVHMLFSSVGSSRGIEVNTQMTHVIQAACNTHFHRNNAYPVNTLLKSAKWHKDAVLNDLMTPNKEDAASLKNGGGGESTQKKAFWKLLPLHNKFRTITTDCTSHSNATRAVRLYCACLIGRGFDQRLHYIV